MVTLMAIAADNPFPCFDPTREQVRIPVPAPTRRHRSGILSNTLAFKSRRGSYSRLGFYDTGFICTVSNDGLDIYMMRVGQTTLNKP